MMMKDTEKNKLLDQIKKLKARLKECEQYKEQYNSSRARLEHTLEKQQSALAQKNVDLKEILEQVSLEKKRVIDDITSNIENILIPLVKKIRLSGNEKEKLDLLEKELKKITSHFGRKIVDPELRLTPREIEICNMIKNHLSSKEIALLLNISFQTVIKHRKNIRKKLGMSNQDINLNAYLREIS